MKIGAFGKSMAHSRQQRKKDDLVAYNPKVGYPKGFDITLADAVAKLDLNEQQIEKLGKLTAEKRSPLAHATIGHQVYYRERQIKELIVDAPIAILDELVGVKTGRLIASGEQA